MKKPFKKIKTLDDALKIVGLKKIKYGKIGRPKKSVRANKRLSVIVEALNKGTKLDKQGVSPFGSNDIGTIMFPSVEIADHASKFFKDELRNYLGQSNQ